MSDDTTEQIPASVTRHGTYGFERKVSDGDYGHTVESIFLPYEVVEGNFAATVRNAIVAREEAVGIVLNGLNVPFELSEDGTLREKPRPVVSAPAAPHVAAPVYGSSPAPSSGGGYEILRRKKVNGVGVPDPEWLPAQIEDAKATAARKGEPTPGPKFWDNRQDDGTAPANPKAPWFKCKETGQGIWAPKA